MRREEIKGLITCVGGGATINNPTIAPTINITINVGNGADCGQLEIIENFLCRLGGLTQPEKLSANDILDDYERMVGNGTSNMPLLRIGD